MSPPLNPIVTQGFGWDCLMVTRGYGYVAVVVPTPGKLPRVVYVKKEYALRLAELGVITPYDAEATLHPLSVARLAEVTELLLKGLGIRLPVEITAFTQELAALFGIAERDLDIEKLGIVIGDAKEVTLVQLKAMGMCVETWVLNTMKVKSAIRAAIDLEVPVHLLDLEELKKYYKILELLDRLDEL